MVPNDRSREIPIEVSRGTPDELPFHCVTPLKLVLLSITSLGLYELYWFYKNWVRIKAQSGRDIRPFWRALFSVWFCYAFASTVNSAAASAHLSGRVNAGIVAGAYMLLLAAARLPDPYWMVALFSFAPLIPVAQQIRGVHEALRPGFDSTVGWGAGSLGTLAIGSLVMAFAVAGVFGPPSYVLRTAEIPASYNATLEEAGILHPGEKIRLFYSAGLFSILEDGNLLTQERVVSYETVDGELLLESAKYGEVAALDVDFAENAFEGSIVRILKTSGGRFLMIVSSEKGRDKEFVAAIRSRMPPEWN